MSTPRIEINGKILGITKEEKWLQLEKPLLQDFQLSSEELLTQLKGYLVYIVDKDDKIQYWGFLRNYTTIIIPPISKKLATNYTARVQNRLTQQFENYKFIEESYRVIGKAMIAKVSATAQKSRYFRTKNTKCYLNQIIYQTLYEKLLTSYQKIYLKVYSQNLNQSKSTDYQ